MRKKKVIGKIFGASLLLCLVLVFSVIGGLAGESIGADDGGRTYPIMHPDRETLEEWIAAYNAAPRAYIDMKEFQVPSPRGSQNLLSHLDYTPSERDQGHCDNCWAWAGTGCLGIALDVQKGINDRLSVQYINSCEHDVIGKVCCSGGRLSDFTDFYDPDSGTGQCIPWSNTNAYWQDGDASCNTECLSISTTPNYPITSIQEEVVPTLPPDVIDQATAIANIKYFLDDHNKAVWFSFFLPDSDAWDDFYTFWNKGGEEDVYDIDKFCGHTYDPAHGGGHAVLCVGYNDEAGTANDYWIMLNSWGTTAGRPNGLFRINMDMAYDGTNPGIGYSFHWETLDVTFGAPNNPPNTPSNPSPANHATGVSINADLSWTGGDPDTGDTVTYDVYFGTSAAPPLVCNDQARTTYDLDTLSDNTKYYWKIVATDNHEASTTGPLWDFTTGLPGPTVTWNLPYGLNADPAAVNIWAYPGDAIQITLSSVDSTMPDGLLLWHYCLADGWRFYKKGWGASNTLVSLIPGDGYIGIVPTASVWEIPQR